MSEYDVLTIALVALAAGITVWFLLTGLRERRREQRLAAEYAEVQFYLLVNPITRQARIIALDLRDSSIEREVSSWQA